MNCEVVRLPLPTELAWVAGFFDGEGCIRVPVRRPETRAVSPTVALAISQGTQPVLDHVQRLLGFGIVRQYPGSSVFRFEYRVTKAEEVIQFSDVVAPYCVIKQEQLRLASELAWTILHQGPEGYKKRHDLALEILNITAARNRRQITERAAQCLT